MNTIRSLLLVAMGGALGSAARFLLSKAVQEHAATAFPLATFTVNVVGCLVIGIVYGLSARADGMGDGMKLLLTTGFCGGFTTFSTFCNEGCSLLRGGNAWTAFAYMAASLAAGLAAVVLGLWLTQRAGAS